LSFAISIEQLSKRYRLGAARERRGLRHVLEEALRTPFGRRSSETGEEFWALRELTATIGEGEVVGVVGRNGAGKSTLLKILSRITEPTSGRARFRGRLASLLEVGTGFHPDLTGRENIFLNGAILGMTRAETRRRFDEIVAFAEIERFLDTPVKRYSSGMYVRLAFAVAAHLEPEILLIDEVLAVGDAAFQKKCLGKMGEISRGGGRTVLFVSHNMAAVRALCSRALYMADGQLALDSAPGPCIAAYLRDSFEDGHEWRAAAETEHALQVTSLRVAGRGLGARIDADDGFAFEVDYIVREPLRNGLVELWVLTADGTHLMTLGEHDADAGVLGLREPGTYRAQVQVPGRLLNTGSYFVRVNSGIAHQATFDHFEALRFEITEARPHPARENRRGLLLPLLPWRTLEFEPARKEARASQAA
jgi:lipopolysaccharide transport system ATP-binding protein